MSGWRPSYAVRITAIVAACARACWRSCTTGRGRSGAPTRRTASSTVGFLPVTCHLTCPVTDFATRTTTTSTGSCSQRFIEFPTMVEALKARKIEATFMLAPLAMMLRAQGVPIKIVYLGHRDGSTVMVREELRDAACATCAARCSRAEQATPTSTW